MKMGIVGLGRMGSAIGYRVVQAGNGVIGFDPSQAARTEAEQSGIRTVDRIEDLAREADIIWIMVPAGEITEQVITQLAPLLPDGSVIIDGGNSNYKDSIRHAQSLVTHGIFFLDCGTSGGVAGREHGFCLMVGGDTKTYSKVHSLLAAIAAPGGLAHVGPSGAGHYVKMVHNGIEYGILQAYAEGFHVLKEGHFKNERLNFEEISRIWNTSSVIRSWILELAHNVFEKDQELKDISGEVAEGGTGRWTVQEAKEQNIPIPVIETTLKTRAWSRETGGNYTTKIIAMLRKQFGGHAVKKTGKTE